MGSVENDTDLGDQVTGSTYGEADLHTALAAFNRRPLHIRIADVERSVNFWKSKRGQRQPNAQQELAKYEKQLADLKRQLKPPVVITAKIRKRQVRDVRAKLRRLGLKK